MKKLSHTDEQGRAQMVGVGSKPDSERAARAEGSIRLSPSTVALIEQNEIKKGDVLTVAEIAGVQAAKRTSELIPLCHNILLNRVSVRATLEKTGVKVECIAESHGKTALASGAGADHLVEHEQEGRRGHVTEALQHGARGRERRR